MDMEIIEEEVKEFRLVYDDLQGDGYSFPCDADGNILWETISSPTAAKKSLDFCKARPGKWTLMNGEVVTIVSHKRYGICPRCGRRVYIDGKGYYGAFSCDCGQWYNRFGQALKPPEDWEEDY